MQHCSDSWHGHWFRYTGLDGRAWCLSDATPTTNKGNLRVSLLQGCVMPRSDQGKGQNQLQGC